MRVFNLPDLGEGLPDAEIVKWLVAEGDEVELDQPMVSMETAKAVVEVPSPFRGRIRTLHGDPGDIIDTGQPLVTFDDGDSDAVDAEDQEPEDEAASPPADAEDAAREAPDDGDEGTAPATAAHEPRDDQGTVVGKVPTGGRVVRESMSSAGAAKFTPATRALARKLGVDLAQVAPTGKGGVITAKDVRQAAEAGTARLDPDRGPPTAPSSTPADGDWEPVRGTRRTMARSMAQAHAAVVPTTLCEDADLAAWEGRQDLTVRLLRALVAGARREPSLNAWFDADGPRRIIHAAVHAGIAVDTEDGLFVATLREADRKTPAEVRADLDRLRENVANRSIPPEELSGYTVILSNVGVYAGRYASPVIAPPCVAILACGRLRDQVVAAHGGIAVHPVLPLSLTFDHRAVTGGEAARFLAACIEDLGQPF